MAVPVVAVVVLRLSFIRLHRFRAAVRLHARGIDYGVVMSREITHQTEAWQHGDRAALERAMPGLYQSLHQIARQRLAREAHSVTIEPTDLVQEAMARLLDSDKAFADRPHFLAVGCAIHALDPH